MAVQQSPERCAQLRTACRVNVDTGFAPSSTGKKRERIESFRPVRFTGLVGMASEARAGTTTPFETETEYVRDASSLSLVAQTRVGFSANDEALILVSNQLYVVPRTKLIRFDVTRLTPAKGGSTSHVHCQTEATGVGNWPLLVAQPPDPDGVTTRKWRICPTFKNVSGTQVGLTVDVVAFSALRAS